MVSFWDTSAVVPLLIREPASRSADKVFAATSRMVIWTFTPVEAFSAFCRLRRERRLSRDGLARSEERLDELVAACAVVREIDGVKRFARRLLRSHSIRAADAMQLGAALCWSAGIPENRTVVVADGPLADAAANEGFRVQRIRP